MKRFATVKMLVIPILTYGYNIISIKLLTGFYINDKLTLKFIQKNKGSRIVNIRPDKKAQRKH